MTLPEKSSTISESFQVNERFTSKERGKVGGDKIEGKNWVKSLIFEESFLDGSCLQNMIASPTSSFILVC